MTAYIDVLLSYCKRRGISEKDIVPVVRCKYCKFWDKESDGERRYCAASGSYWRADEYCSDGERRKDGSN